jgi:acetyl esterase/lipase
MKTFNHLLCIILLFLIHFHVLAQRTDKLKKAQNPPFKIYPNTKITRNIVYDMSNGIPLKLDLYLPKKAKTPFPAIVYIHGGAWRGGTKLHFRRQASYFADKGIAGLCIEYRLKDEKIFPAAIQDCKCAVRWARANAKKYNIDPNRIGAMGGSAGGHLAALLGTSGNVKALEGEGPYAKYSSNINLVISFNGVSDMVRLYRYGSERVKTVVKEFMGSTPDKGAALYKQASPVFFIDSKDPPVLLLHGTEDETVPYEQSLYFKDRLEKKGVMVELFAGEEGYHGFFNHPPYYRPALKKTEAFIRLHFFEK